MNKIRYVSGRNFGISNRCTTLSKTQSALDFLKKSSFLEEPWLENLKGIAFYWKFCFQMSHQIIELPNPIQSKVPVTAIC